MTTQDLITTALAGNRFISFAAEGKRDAYKARQNIKRTAQRMGVLDQLMVWAERGNVYIAKRV